MTTEFKFKQVFDLQDDNQLKDLVSRVAARLVLLSQGAVDELSANPIALQMIAGYMEYLHNKICKENGITINTKHDADVKSPDFFNIHKETKH